MQRVPALQDLSRDHFQALFQCQQVRWALDGHPRAKPLEEALADLLRFWDDEGRLHFREEEEVLLPVCARHFLPSEEESVRRMLDDHAWLRERIEALREAREGGADVLTLAREVSERLEAHVHLEEREVFEGVQARLTAGDLEDLHARSVAFREACRGEGAVGRR